MSYINDLGKNYAEEYRQFGEKILAENKEILKKSGVTPPLFNNDLEPDNAGFTIDIAQTEDNEEDEQSKKGTDKKKSSYKETSIGKNTTLTDVKSSTGMMNTVYKNSIKSSNLVAGSSNDLYYSTNEFNESLEESDGSDDNDNMANFMSEEYEKGLHLDGGGYTYYEKNNESSNTSFAARLMGSYKTKNEKFTLSYGGSFEYSVQKNNYQIYDTDSNLKYKQSQDNNQTETKANSSTQTIPLPSDNNTNKSDNKSGNAIFMAKYKDKIFVIGLN